MTTSSPPRGLARAGWRFAWDDKPSRAYLRAEEDANGSNLSWSIGAIVTEKGLLRSVRFNGSTFIGALSPGNKIVSVNGLPFTAATLKAAIAISAETPIKLEGGAGPRLTENLSA